jgi:serine/threonine-protein kinase RsbW
MDTVKVTIPASPQFLHVIRLVAAGLASRLGFTIDDIEDLKIGVDELAAYMTGTQGRDGYLEISFGIEDDRIEIAGMGRLAEGQRVRDELTEFSRMILDTVVDSATLQQRDGAPSFVLTKSRSS